MYDLTGFCLEENLDVYTHWRGSYLLPVSRRTKFPAIFRFEVEIVSTAPAQAWIPRRAHEAAHEGVEGQNWLDVWTKTWRKTKHCQTASVLLEIKHQIGLSHSFPTLLFGFQARLSKAGLSAEGCLEKADLVERLLGQWDSEKRDFAASRHPSSWFLLLAKKLIDQTCNPEKTSIPKGATM